MPPMTMPSRTTSRSLRIGFACSTPLALLVGCLGSAPPPSSGPSAPSASTAPSGSSSPPSTVVAKAGVLIADAAPAAGKNMVVNGAFAGDALRPWSLGVPSPQAARGAIESSEFCVAISSPGTRTYDVALRQGPLTMARGHHYQVRLRTHATAAARLRVVLRHAGLPATEYWTAIAPASPTAQDFAGSFDAPADDEGVEFVVELGGELAARVPYSICLDNIELNDPQFVPPVEWADTQAPPRVRVNQVGYLPRLSKIATVAATETTPLDWQLVNAAGQVKASGKTRVFGEDRAAGERVHQIDFSSFTGTGKNWKLRVGNDESLPFAIEPDVYHRLKYDALSFFYLQRSGIDIKMPYAGQPIYERPAGHVGDKSVPCAPEANCNYSLDVSGGWYDAGDHGKYVVNSGLSVWALQNTYETLMHAGATAADFADGKMNIPEAKNGKPDLLDEARWNLEFMLKMQVPDGQPHAGMAHHKIHGEKWSPIPTMPHQDPIKRYLRPVSTAATLNLAAVAAQGARLWQKLDPDFAKRCLAAAERAYAAAKANPLIRAEKEVQGGGAYGDGDVADESYWAAVELFITTGKPEYKDALTKSPLHSPKVIPTNVGTIGWQNVAPLGKLSLLVAANGLGEESLANQKAQIVSAAERTLSTIDKRGYRMPLRSDNGYVWGSNGDVLNAAIVLGAAYRLTKDIKFANGVVDSIDYILGRNPLAFSYVAGTGARSLHNPHHRVWAHQKDERLPVAPPGAVSGGPNSMLQDPYIRKLGKGGCAPQTCYVDNIDSYSTNEVAINWNAAFAWDVAFLDEVGKSGAGTAGATGGGANRSAK